jgi:predicted amidohydrolase
MARYVRVSSISFGGAGGGGSAEEKVERNLRSALEWIDQAATDKPDIIVLPEIFPATGVAAEEWVQIAQTVPGPITDAVGERARRYNAYIICPMVERKGGKVYNSAVLIDRNGQPMGSYHKIHPTIGEIEAGITPGTDPVVFETDFGWIGCAICFDLNFRDVMEGLKGNGAEAVFFSSMYRGGLQLSIWAFDFGVWMISATPGEMSAIVDPLGKVKATSWNYNRIISKVINLDYAVLHIDYSHPKWNDIKAKYGNGVELDVSAPEGVFCLYSHAPDVTVQDIIEEFELETRDEYFARANRIREDALKRG